MRGRHDTNRLYGPRWNREKYLTTFGVQPAGRQANATQEAFARARSVWPRRDSTTGSIGSDRGRTSPAEMARGRPKPTCAGPPGRARACRVLCGPHGALSLASLVSRLSSLIPRLFWSLCESLSSLLFYVFTTTSPYSSRSLRRLRARHSPSRFFLAVSPSLLSPPRRLLPSARAAKMRWFRGREREMLNSGASIKGRRNSLRDNCHKTCRV